MEIKSINPNLKTQINNRQVSPTDDLFKTYLEGAQNSGQTQEALKYFMLIFMKQLSSEIGDSMQMPLNMFEAALKANSGDTANKAFSYVTQPETRLPVNSALQSSNLDSLINQAANKYGVDANLIKSVIKAESSFNPSSTSEKGAMGLMQLMPSTAKWLGVTNAYDPQQNIEGGTKYLRYLLTKFHGDLTKAVGAYNAGPGNIMKNIWPQETVAYVQKVLGKNRS